MSRRDTTDPLLRAFLDDYKLNLLAIPRRDAKIGDVYVQTKQGIAAPGQLRSLLTPAPKMPPANKGEPIAQITKKQTRALSLKIGLGLLEGFLGAIGATVAVGKIKAAYEQSGATTVRFKIKKATRDSIDLLKFGKALTPCKLDKAHPFVQSGNRYYVTVAVVRSPSISVIAEDSAQKAVDLEVSAVKNVANVKGKIKIKHEGDGELTYQGPEPLVFGVELVEMTYDEAQSKFLLSGMRDAVAVRAAKKAAKKIERAFIGDPKRGDVFLRMAK
jgi:hypothetical protein